MRRELRPTVVRAGILGFDRELGAIGAVSVAIALFFAVRLPPHGDASAHFHRTLLVLKGDFLWDNLWFRGSYHLGSYSLLYYLPAALVGNTAIVIVATLAAALAYALLLRGLWGRTGRWSTWLFAVFAVQPLLRTEYPFAVGCACLLGALVALQRRKSLMACVAAALCAGTSPLAFLFLVLAVVGIWLAHPKRDRKTFVFGGATAGLAGLLFLISRVFATPWSAYPFTFRALLQILVVSAVGIVLTLLARGPRPLGGIYATWGIVSVIGYFVETPIGLNFDRPAFLLVPLLIVPALQLGGRARLAACVAILPLLPLASPALAPSLANAFASHPNEARLWSDADAFLRPRTSPDYRVEVVPTAAHWEAYYLPKAGIPIARGWYRQLDIAMNGLFYRHSTPLSAATYRRWLDANAVQWVVIARASGIDAIAGFAEKQLVESGRSHLLLVRSTPHWAFYRVPHATPMLRPAGLSRVTAITSDTISGFVLRRGTYQLDVTYMPYWETRAGISVRRGPAGTTDLRVTRPGAFTLRAAADRVFGLG